MTVLEIGARVHYHSNPTALGTITKARIVGKGEDAEPEYKVIWDDCPEDGACQAWPCEIVPLAT